MNKFIIIKSMTKKYWIRDTLKIKISLCMTRELQIWRIKSWFTYYNEHIFWRNNSNHKLTQENAAALELLQSLLCHISKNKDDVHYDMLITWKYSLVHT